MEVRWRTSPFLHWRKISDRSCSTRSRFGTSDTPAKVNECSKLRRALTDDHTTS